MKSILMALICSFVVAAQAADKAERKPSQADPITSNIGKMMAAVQSSCKPITRPKRAECQLVGKQYGSDVSKKLIVPLVSSESDVGFESKYAASGSIDLTNFLTSVSSRKNQLKIEVTTETHGNAPGKCQIQQYLNGELFVAGTTIRTSRFVEYKMGDDPKVPELDIKMVCKLY